MLRGYFFLILLLGCCFGAQAAVTSKTIQLKYQSSERIIAVLQPHLQENEHISGDAQRIVLSAEPQRLDALLQAIRQLDVYIRQLQVSLAMTDYDTDLNAQAKNKHKTLSDGTEDLPYGEEHAELLRERETDGIDAPPEKIKYDVKRFRSRYKSKAPSLQQFQVAEGAWASIKFGRAIPHSERITHPDGTVTLQRDYRTAYQQLSIHPQINGDHVTLQINQQADDFSDENGGNIRQQALHSHINGPLNTWILLSKLTAQLDEDTIGRSYSSGTRRPQYGKIWIKVEVVNHEQAQP